MTCQARREGDQMCCGRCGLAWDVDDEERPECRQDGPEFEDGQEFAGWADRSRGEAAIADMRETLNAEPVEPWIPEEDQS